MPKSKFNRYSLKHNLLKKVSVSIDFDGLTNVDEFINALKRNELADKFAAYRKVLPPNASRMGTENRAYNYDGVFINNSYQEIKHLFFNYTGQDTKDNVELVLNSSNISILIDCVDYKNIDIYLDLIHSLIKRLLDIDAFVKIKNVGIRKIGAFEHTKVAEVFKVFLPEMFTMSEHIPDHITEKVKCLRASYDDTLVFLEQYPVLVNLKRLVRHLQDPVTKEHKLQAILDIDGHIEEKALSQNMPDASADDVMNALKLTNEVLFETFKMAVTQQYLEQHGCI